MAGDEAICTKTYRVEKIWIRQEVSPMGHFVRSVRRIHMKFRWYQRPLSLLVALVMLVQLMPGQCFAVGTDVFR